MSPSRLALRRLPWVLSSMRCIPDLRNVREGVLAGWFGPIGVSALFYVGLAEQEGAPRDVWTVGTLLVAVSILAFALSGPPVVRLLGRRGAGPDAGR
jgi:NhaP-type Na+/H+ or K+/H+ antiporter